MPFHVWGDEFDFEHLDEAQLWINKVYRRLTGLRMHTKEKYGTLRYEYEYLWLKTDKLVLQFLEILKRATVKFPLVAGEIVCDAVTMIDVIDEYSAYYKGYFEAILMVKHKTQWEKF